MPNTGVPQDNYIVVPLDSYNVVWFEGAKGKVTWKDDAKTSTQRVTKANAAKIADNIARNFTSGHKTASFSKDLLASIMAQLTSTPDNVLAVFGKNKGFGKYELAADGTTYKIETGVTAQNTYGLSFRFLQHKDGKTQVPDTAYTPKNADAWLATLNRIYGPQANIIFDLIDTDWVTTDTAVSQPVSREAFLKFAVKPTGKNNVVMHLVGKWAGGESGHSRGTYFNKTGIAVINDNINQSEIPEGIDPFMLTMAHELMHFVREKRGFDGHPPRNRILLSDKIQTLRFDKQLSMDANMPGN